MRLIKSTLFFAINVVRGLFMPIAVAFAYAKLDRFHNLLRGDVEAELKFFRNPMSISRALRENRQQYEIYKEISQTGLIPAAFLLHGSNTAVLAGFWGLMREAFDAEGHVPRDVLEVLAAEVSELSRCELCVSVHAAFMDGMGFTDAAAYYNSPKEDRNIDLLGKRHQDVVKWVSAYPQSDFFANFSGDDLDTEAKAELCGTALAFHYIGGIYPVIMTDLDFIHLFMKSTGLKNYREVPRVRDRVYRAAVSWIGHSMRKHRPPGQSVALGVLRRSGLNLSILEDIAWSMPNSYIANAAAGFLAATEELARSYVGEPAMGVIREYVRNQWDAIVDPSEGNNHWAKEAVAKASLDSEADRLAAEIGLMTALSPWQLNEERGVELLEIFVDEHSEVCQGNPDPALLGLLSWSRVQASRKFVARLAKL